MLQAVLYALAAEQMLGQVVPSGRLFYATLRGNYRPIDIKVNDIARERMRELLTFIDEAIDNGEFHTNPRKDACGVCDYQSVCGPYGEERAHRKTRVAGLEQLRSIRLHPPKRRFSQEHDSRCVGRDRQDNAASVAHRASDGVRGARRNIVAVTFTNAAAGEMKLRVRQKLEEELLASSGASRENLRTGLAQLERAFIGTIYSRAHLLRQRPVEARVDPAFEELAAPERLFAECSTNGWTSGSQAAPPCYGAASRGLRD